MPGEKPTKIFKNNAVNDGVSVALFKQKYGYSIAIQQTWKAGDGSWQRSNSMYAKHLPGLICLLHEVLAFCNSAATAQKSGVDPDQPVESDAEDDDDMPY